MPNYNRLLEVPPARTEEFGLLAWLEKTRVHLPLKGVECRFRVCGELVGVEIDQVFHQDNHQPLDCVYTFPLPGDAAVYRCQMHVNGRVVTGRVEELARAIELAREKKDAGFRTALAQMERDNLFTLELGNIAPGDVVVVRFAYFQTLTRLEDQVSFHVPFCPGVRYIPGTPLLRTNLGRGVADDSDEVPDASRISPPRMDRLHPDAAYLAVEGQIDALGGRVTEVRSPSHSLVVKDGTGSVLVRLADKAAVPDCDLVLRWTELGCASLGSAAWLTGRSEESFALVRLVAPREVASVSAHAQDVYFLVDRSGSMAGAKWSKACEAFRAFLRTLEPQDRVWATFFETQFQDLAEKPLPPAALLSDPAVQGIERIATGGGTELLPALKHVLTAVERHSRTRNVVIVVITDGQVGNEAAIIETLRPLPNVRVHTFGVDTAVNDAFLKKLARQQRGTCSLVTPSDDIAGTVSRLGTRLRRPVLTDIRLRGAWELAETNVPDLHGGETLSLSLRATRGLREIEWEGRQPDGTVAVFSCQVEDQALEAVPLLWARRRIEQLLSEGKTSEAIALAKLHNLVCPGTAFVAWDEVEKISVGLNKLDLYQPAMEQRVGYSPADTTMLFAAGACAEAPRMRSLHFLRSDKAANPGMTQRILKSAARLVAPTKAGADSSANQMNSGASGPWIPGSRGAGWRAALEQDELLQGDRGSELLDWLEQWSVADPPIRARREANLEELAKLMADLSGRQATQPDRVRALEAWLEATFCDQPGFLEPLRAAMRQLGASLMAAPTTELSPGNPTC